MKQLAVTVAVSNQNKFWRTLIIASLWALTLGGTGVTPAHAAITTFSTGSLIIPMDTGTDGQNYGMLRAYGLVYDLLKHDVPVYWVINPSKSSNGDDFSISLSNQLQDVRTGATLSPRTYRGGPFIIDSANADAALPIIQAWQASVGDVTTVHLLIGTQTINQDVSRVLIRAPRIAILMDGNEQIAFNDLNASGISDALGNSWTASSPDVLSESAVVGPTITNDSDGALFHQPSGLPRYCFITAMHSNSTSQTSEVVAETRNWLNNDANAHLFLQCESARVFENDTNGYFLTNAGLDDDGSATSNPMNRLPSHPLTQLDGTFEVDSGAVDSMRANDAPGATPDYKTGVQTLINESSAALPQRIVLLHGRMDGLNSNGQVTYLAGHDYSTGLPITSNPQTNGIRIFLNAIFQSDCALSSVQSDPNLTLIAPTLINANTIQYSLNFTNPGPRPLENIRITDILPAGATYISGSSSLPPTINSGGMLIWDLPPLDPGESSTLTFNLNVTTNGDYQNSVQMLFSNLHVQSISSNEVTTTRTASAPSTPSAPPPADSTQALAAFLPKTGFAPKRITALPIQTTHYADLGSIWLEIPSLNIQTNIVGVPQSNNSTWDVKWLGNDTGWLNGTAFPTWVGNSVITGHVYNANGLPGPFVNMKNLKYGDHIVVHLYGEQYIFEIRKNILVRPFDSSMAFEHLTGYAYVTLITCEKYIEENDSYLYRRIVRAVLVDVK